MSINTGNTIDLPKIDMIKTQANEIRYKAENDTVRITEDMDLRDADFMRDGADLVLKWDHGSQITIEHYLSNDLTAPDLHGANGLTLTAGQVQSFIKSGASYDIAQSHTLSDVSAVGSIAEVTGTTTLTRVDGSVEVAQIGTPVYQGDIVETDEDGAVNIAFIDETSFAVSENAKLAIDEYVFDPATESGTTNFSVLKGMFVFTSGLIGREDPDDVTIETPMGSIGIRGTIIAGDTNSGEITVVEGAIVLRDFSGNEVTLANQFETAQFKPIEGRIEHMGEMDATEMASKFSSVSPVSADLFSSIEDTASESLIPKEGISDKSEEPMEKIDAVEENDKPTIEGEDPDQPTDMKQSASVDETKDSALEDGQPHDAHKAHEGDGERMEMLLEKAETLIMETGKENMLMGEDGQLDQSELMEILVNNSEAREAIREQIKETRAKGDAEHQADENTQGNSQELGDENPIFTSENQEEEGPIVIQIGATDLAIQAQHDNVVLVGDTRDNYFYDNDVSFKNVSMIGREGPDNFNITIAANGSKEIKSVKGGAGIDTLWLNAEGGGTGTLDFSKVGEIKSIEVISLSNGSSQETLVLSPFNIFESVGHGGELKIEGTGVDEVHIDFGSTGEWTATGGGGPLFQEFEHNNGSDPITTLLIDTDVVANSGGNITGFF